MNRTVMEKVRCLLTKLGLSEKLWVKAAVVSVYLMNRTPFKTPEEVAEQEATI